MFQWNGEIRVPLVLTKKMDFLSYQDALKFHSEVSDIIRAENVSTACSTLTPD